MTPLPLAHAQWFVDRHRDFPVEWHRLGSVATLGALAVTALVLTGAGGASHRFPPAALMPAVGLRHAADRAPALLAVTLGLGLIGMSALGYVWMRPPPNGAVGAVVLGLQTLVGVWLLLGARRRAAALVVIALTALVSLVLDPVATITAAYVPAAALALIAIARGRPGAALTTLRIGMGVGLIAAAVVEKVAVPSLTVAVLESHPQLNLLADMGLAGGPDRFTLLLGCVELVLGGLLLSGTAIQLVALVTLGPLVATVPLFGATELIGHLPIYGVLLAIAVLAPARTRVEVAS
jgi:hypothetical protein